MSTPVAALVTGLGLVTPLGASLAETLDALPRGVDTGASVHRTRAGTAILTASVPRDRVEVTLPTVKLEKYLGWPTRLALRAAAEARRMAGLQAPEPGTPAVPAERIGVYAAVGTSGLDCVEFFAACSAAWRTDGARDYGMVGGRPLRLIDPHFALRTLANGPAAFVAMQAGARGPSMVYAQSACAAVSALQCAIDDLALERCDVAIVVACDSLLAPTSVIVRERAGILDGQPAPVLSEGAAAVVLERDARATVRPRGGIACAEIFRPEQGAPVDSPAWREVVALFERGTVPPRTWGTAADGADALLASAFSALSLAPAAREQTKALGDLGAASALAWTVLALAAQDPRPSVIVTVEPTGQAGVIATTPAAVSEK